MNIIYLIVLLVLPSSAIAYIGPGMAGGVVAASFAIITAIFICIFGVIWFPIRRMLKKKKDKLNLKDSSSANDK